MSKSIFETAKLRLDDEFVLLGRSNIPHNLRIDAKRTGNVDNRLGILGRDIHLHAMPHVEYLIHLLPIGARLFANDAEERRYREEVVLDHQHIFDKVHHLGLRTARTVYHAVHLGAQLIEHLLDDRRISACGRENQFAGIDAQFGNLVGQFYPVESTRDVLFEAVYSQNMSPNQGSQFCYMFGPAGNPNHGGGWNIIAPINCVIIPNFTCKYDAATKTWSSPDRRFLWSLSTYKYKDATSPAVILAGTNAENICKQIRINKFHSNRDDLPPHSIGTGVNNPILRLSDVCLIAAEALGELSWMDSGTISEEALDYLNIVRRNAGVTEYTMSEVRHAEPIVLHQAFNSLVPANREIKGYTTTTDIEHWRRTLLNERMMELLGEGHRWYDLVRLGLLKPVVDGVTAFAGHGNPKVYLERKIEDFHVFRPIPLREMQVHQEYLVQNYGYF